MHGLPLKMKGHADIAETGSVYKNNCTSEGGITQEFWLAESSHYPWDSVTIIHTVFTIHTTLTDSQ